LTRVLEMDRPRVRVPEAATSGSSSTAGSLPADGADGRRIQSRPWLTTALWLAGVVAAVVAVRAALPEMREGIAALGHANVGLLVVAVVCEAVALLTLPLTFRATLRMLGGRIRYAAALNGTLGAFALSRVVPGGGLAGGLYTAREFMRAGNSAAVAGGAVTIASGITMLALGVVVVGGAVLEAATGRGSIALAWSAAAFLVAVVAVCAALVGVVRDPDRLDRLCTRAGRLVRRPAQAAVVYRHLTEISAHLTHPRGLGRVTGWAVFNWVVQLVALWIVFVAFGVAMPVGVLILGFGAAHLATALPHTPGGLGVVEAGMTATYIALGIPVATALVGVLCYRLLGHWLPVVAALPLVVPHLRRSSLEAGR
jgi:uncharacterized protein (TIRG00374 family)